MIIELPGPDPAAVYRKSRPQGLLFRFVQWQHANTELLTPVAVLVPAAIAASSLALSVLWDHWQY